MHDISGYGFWLKKFLIYTLWNSQCLKFTKMSHFQFLCEFCENVNLEKCEFGKLWILEKKMWILHSVWKSHKKVAFNIASEACYVYILSGQKLIKNAKNGQLWRIFETWNLRSNIVTRQVYFNRIKNGGICPKKSNATFWVIFKHCDFDPKITVMNEKLKKNPLLALKFKHVKNHSEHLI